ncbi:hypothetical protein HZH66_004281 [Vespula vulgaris]|uniref:Uncharacterized protein n=1 Tax=Vespula vulgaris TaxID=7454 RepID=A0A834NCV7_VESVU|nr:hypothetical protein HZH66_004281 [Vespula vulgaris]
MASPPALPLPLLPPPPPPQPPPQPPSPYPFSFCTSSYFELLRCSRYSFGPSQQFLIPFTLPVRVRWTLGKGSKSTSSGGFVGLSFRPQDLEANFREH